MPSPTIYALDFDGVICHSAIETAMTGWKAAQECWLDMSNQAITQAHIDSFCQVRPLIETGYEATLIMRHLQQGGTVEDLQQRYQYSIKTIIQKNNLVIDSLKAQFGKLRDQWISHNKSDWLANNPLFDDFATRLQNLPSDSWVIITTKQERFVQEILQHHQIQLADEQLYGMDRLLSKQQVLEQLINKHPNTALIFIEDRLPTLLEILNNPKLNTIKLQLADWGYNSTKDQEQAKEHGIDVISTQQFIN